jgi:diguanylate cyclase (GGDEF)-like protein
VLATLIPTIAIGWLAYPLSKRALTQTIATELLGVSSQTASDLAGWIREKQNDLKTFGNSYEVTDNVGPHAAALPAGRARLESYLSSVRERTPLYRELVVFDADGRAVGGVAAHGTLMALPKGWIERLRAGEPMVGSPIWDSTTKGMSVVLARPVQPTTSRPIGAIAARVDIRELQQRLATNASGHAGVAYVVSEDGLRLMTSRPDPRHPLAGRLELSALRWLLIPSRDPVEYANPDGAKVIGTMRPILDTRWYVLTELPQSEGFRQVNRLLLETVLVLAGLLLVVGSLAYLLGLLLVRPLDRLTHGAARVAEGDFDVQLPVITGGELGYLTTVFNEMVGQLKKSMEQVDLVNETLREKNVQLERLSLTDPLTGLFNRRHLMTVLENELKRAARNKHQFGLLMLDVDHFKTYNDAFGHQAGDDALMKVAGVLKAELREVDCAARYGGEEFVALLPETSPEAAAEVAERICQAVRRTAFQGDPVTISVGVAAFPAQANSLEALIAAADGALYHAKRQGRDRVVRADWSREPAEVAAPR